MNKDETRQNYLEAILIISKKNPHVRAINIAEYLSFSRASVSVALKHFKDDGYLDIIDNVIYLTPKGKAEAEKIYERHEVIAQVLMHLGVDEKIAYRDSCMIEHDLSDESFAAIKKHIQEHKA